MIRFLSGKRSISCLIVLSLVLSLVVFAHAASTPDIQGAFSTNTETVLAEYRAKYGWSKDQSRVREWESTVNGEERSFQRLQGFQTDYLMDQISTTRQYLGLSGNGTDSGFGGKTGSATMTAVALAEVGKPESIEDPPGSHNVRYNTWFYGEAVHCNDANDDGSIDAADGPENYFPWSAVFMSWCANECRLLGSGLFPKTSSCEALYDYMVNTNGFDACPAMDTIPFDGGRYQPVQGDL